MAAEPKPIEIDEHSEIGAAIQRAAANQMSLRVTVGTITYLVDAQLATIDDYERAGVIPAAEDDEPDAILNLIGIAGSGEPTDIARFKKEYVAESIEHSWRR